ncbi:hypothetical protein [Nitratireductor pacificus]|uniref:Transmembrane protein n=1 Tax=Nitratireductor pacificus pht-3B TaxID=391937 RepID=K2N7V2_9HYPH|nr:hypothetical protein [Nitratireductor pacificus]EKF20128.1 hypothetical protein NA2_05041 [Nitratireductor pacificus pht-3B]
MLDWKILEGVAIVVMLVLIVAMLRRALRQKRNEKPSRVAGANDDWIEEFGDGSAFDESDS